MGEPKSHSRLAHRRVSGKVSWAPLCSPLTVSTQHTPGQVSLSLSEKCGHHACHSGLRWHCQGLGPPHCGEERRCHLSPDGTCVKAVHLTSLGQQTRGMLGGG